MGNPESGSKRTTVLGHHHWASKNTDDNILKEVFGGVVRQQVIKLFLNFHFLIKNTWLSNSAQRSDHYHSQEVSFTILRHPMMLQGPLGLKNMQKKTQI